MSVELKNNQFLSYLVVLLSLFILVLFTKDEIMSVQSNLDKKEQLNQELSQVREKQENLQKIALEVSQKDSVTKRYLKTQTE
jgi:biopolymer transport protein ExbB/TolQ